MKKKRSPSRSNYDDYYPPFNQYNNDPTLNNIDKSQKKQQNKQQQQQQQQEDIGNGEVTEPDNSGTSSNSSDDKNNNIKGDTTTVEDDNNNSNTASRSESDSVGIGKPHKLRGKYHHSEDASDFHILDKDGKVSDLRVDRGPISVSSSTSSSSSPILTAPLSKLIKTSKTSGSTTQASLISISNDPRLPTVYRDPSPPYSSSVSSYFSSASTSASTSTSTSPPLVGDKGIDSRGNYTYSGNVQSNCTRSSNSSKKQETRGSVSLTRSKLSSILSSSVPSALVTSRSVEPGTTVTSCSPSSSSSSSVSKSLPVSANTYYLKTSRSRDSNTGTTEERGLFLKRYPNDPSSKEGVDIDEMIYSLIGAVDSSNSDNSNNKKKNKDSSSFTSAAFSLGTRRTNRQTSTFPYRSWQIQLVCSVAREIFMTQPTLLRLQAPIKVVGDIHGQFADLLRVFKLSGSPDQTNYLFLGDYVDRGRQSLETILLLLCYKIKYPNNFFMLRGNHESANVTRMYGFYDECKRRKNTKVWKSFIDVFNCLPFAAIVNNKIFCVHGGISPDLKNIKQIANYVHRPTDIPDEGLITDLLWSDPHPGVSDWSLNDRGVSYTFSKRNVLDFCADFKFDLIVRGHMVVEDGYEFFAKKKLVTVFSAPNYCGVFENWGAVLSINSGLMCSFELLKPHQLKKR